MRNWLSASFATEALLQCKDDYGSLDNLWLGLLAQPGTMLYHMSDMAHPFFVTGSTDYGVICWKVRAGRNKGVRYMVLDITSEQPWVLKCITDLDGWMCLPCRALPPTACPLPIAKGIVPSPTDEFGTGATLFRYAAHQGFKGLTAPRLKKLIAHVKLRFEDVAPTLELDMCKALVRAAIPGVTDEQLLNILEKRAMKKPTLKGTVAAEDLENITDFC